MRKADLEDLRAGVITAGDIVARRGNNYEETITQRARELALLKKVAEEYGHDIQELSILTKPGDIVPEQTNNQDNTQDDQDMV